MGIGKKRRTIDSEIHAETTFTNFVESFVNAETKDPIRLYSGKLWSLEGDNVVFGSGVLFQRCIFI